MADEYTKAARLAETDPGAAYASLEKTAGDASVMWTFLKARARELEKTLDAAVKAHTKEPESYAMVEFSGRTIKAILYMNIPMGLNPDHQSREAEKIAKSILGANNLARDPWKVVNTRAMANGPEAQTFKAVAEYDVG